MFNYGLSLMPLANHCSRWPGDRINIGEFLVTVMYVLHGHTDVCTWTLYMYMYMHSITSDLHVLIIHM